MQKKIITNILQKNYIWPTILHEKLLQNKFNQRFASQKFINHLRVNPVFTKYLPLAETSTLNLIEAPLVDRIQNNINKESQKVLKATKLKRNESMIIHRLYRFIRMTKRFYFILNRDHFPTKSFTFSYFRLIQHIIQSATSMRYYFERIKQKKIHMYQNIKYEIIKLRWKKKKSAHLKRYIFLNINYLKKRFQLLKIVRRKKKKQVKFYDLYLYKTRYYAKARLLMMEHIVKKFSKVAILIFYLEPMLHQKFSIIKHFMDKIFFQLPNAEVESFFFHKILKKIINQIFNALQGYKL